MDRLYTRFKQLKEEERKASAEKFMRSGTGMESIAHSVPSARRSKIEAFVSFVTQRVRFLIRIGFVLGGLIIIAGILFGVYYFFFQPPAGAQGIELVVPEETRSGDRITYVIKYRNLNSRPFTDVGLTVSYPEGFFFESAEPEPVDLGGTMWSLPDLASRSSEEVRITGRLFGELDTQPVFGATLEIKIGARRHEITQTASTRIRSVPIDISLVAPHDVVNGEVFAYHLTYRNTQSEPLAAVNLEAILPASFTLTNADPAPAHDTTWTIETLGSFASGEIVLTGFLTGSVDEVASVKVTALLTDPKGVVRKLRDDLTATRIVRELIRFTTTVNGNTVAAVTPGDNLTFSIKFRNVGIEPTEGSQIEFPLDTRFVDPASVVVTNGFLSRTTVVWQGVGSPPLIRLDPGEEKAVSFTARLYSSLDFASLGGKQISFTMAPTFLTQSAPLPIRSEPVTLKFRSSAQFTIFAEYVGGSLPPKVDTESRYRVTWEVAPLRNTIRNIRFSTGLLPGVRLASGTPAPAIGRLITDEAGAIAWEVPEIDVFTENAKVSMSFEIAFTAAVNQVGKIPALLKPTSAVGTDAFIGESLGGGAAELDTTLYGSLTEAEAQVVP
ncbi:MAG: hypothetical protein HY459_01420 [Parcubacteria group bacterium]|nr:hypothetical protein [Parcubacteria group bacterium]